MMILKDWVYEFLSVFVFLRFRSVWALFEHLTAKKQKQGLLVNIYNHCMEKRGGHIAIGATFHGKPYFPHSMSGVFISPRAVIGKNAVIFQHVTIGAVRNPGGKRNGNPIIGDNCFIGAGAKIIGNIRVGNNCRIGANAVVYQDVPDNSIVVCAPTRIITRDEPLDNRFFVLNEKGEEVYWDHGVFRKEIKTDEVCI